MFTVDTSTVAEEVRKAIVEISRNIEPTCLAALERARDEEKVHAARFALTKMCENARFAAQTGYPVCQDTGMCVVFVEIGKDVLLTGEITSYMPEQKQLVYNVSRRTSSEPVFSKEVVKNPDGNIQIKSTYAGQQHTSSRDIYPVEYTIYAQVGVVAKMIDVDTAEIIWVGDDTKEGVSGLDALSSSANALIKSFDKKVRKAKQEYQEKQEKI